MPRYEVIVGTFTARTYLCSAASEEEVHDLFEEGFVSDELWNPESPKYWELTDEEEFGSASIEDIKELEED